MMIKGIASYLCYRLGVGTLPMLSLMGGELAVYCLSGHIVVVPVPFGIGTTGFREIYDRFKNRPRRDYYLLTAKH
jgi:hypothetical protein